MRASWLVVLTLAVAAPASAGSMWLDPAVVQNLPMSGAAWENVRDVANSDWAPTTADIDLKDQDIKQGVKVLAGALVYARTGDLDMRLKVANAIIAAKRTLDTSTEYECQPGQTA